jgi:hypothetical protein
VTRLTGNATSPLTRVLSAAPAAWLLTSLARGEGSTLVLAEGSADRRGGTPGRWHR